MDAIVGKISEWFNTHRKESTMGSSSQRLTPRVERTLHLRYKESTFLKVNELNTSTLEYYVTGDDGSFLVDLARRTCSCKVYDIDKFPCVHVLAALDDGPNNMHKLCSKYYLKEVWALAYVETIYPVPISSDWDIPHDIQDEVVLPPNFIKRRGPIQKTRFPSIGEQGKGRRKRLRHAATSHVRSEVMYPLA